MRRLTREERIVLKEVGTPGEGPIKNETFLECIAQGWGYWGPDGAWCVTEAGNRARELDEALDQS